MRLFQERRNMKRLFGFVRFEKKQDASVAIKHNDELMVKGHNLKI